MSLYAIASEQPDETGMAMGIWVAGTVLCGIVRKQAPPELRTDEAHSPEENPNAPLQVTRITAAMATALTVVPHAKILLIL